jgi:hypothetical protein
MRRWLDRLTRLEEINGGHVCPTYLYRRTLFRCRWFGVYLHHFVEDDWSRDLHDHPKRFVSVGLAGGYVEQTPDGRERTYRAPWVRSFPATHAHRLRMVRPGAECWTLVVVLRASRPWGFFRAGRWVPWRQYVGSADAAAYRSCP